MWHSLNGFMGFLQFAHCILGQHLMEKKQRDFFQKKKTKQKNNLKPFVKKQNKKD